MHWIAPSEKDTDNAALEKRLWDAADQFRSNPGLKSQEYAAPDCPGGTFIGAGVKTVVLFIEKGTRTRKVWFYQLDPGRNMGKTNPLNDADLAEFIALQKTKADSPKSWSVDVAAIDPKTFDLSVKNPNGGEEIAHRSPQDIMDQIAALDAESAEVLAGIRKLL